MANVQIETIQHDRWGSCVLLRNGSIELLATLAFGPRIISLAAAGGRNLFFEDTGEEITQSGEAFDPVGGGPWRIYGGHRLWTSPERIPRTTYPDNEPVSWEKTGDSGIVLKSAPERWTQVVKSIEVQLDPDRPEVRLIHRVTNAGAWPIRFAPWALSVMSAGGRSVVPLTGPDTGPLPNRRLVLWPYSRPNDPRISFTEEALIADQGEGPSPYKMGINNEAGWAAFSNYGDTFIKRYKPVPGGTYPDFGVSFELYTNSLMTELETLGELQEVESGETVSHEETWQVLKGLDLKSMTHQEAVAALTPYVSS